TNAGLLFLVLDDFEERHRLGQTVDRIAQEIRGKLAQIEEAQAFVFIPPPVRGMGAAAGFSMRLQDTLGMDPTGFARVVQEFVGPERVPRYNLFPAAEVNGVSRPGVSSGQSLDIMRELSRDKLPQGVTFEWTDLSYQEAKVGRTGYYIFVLSVIFVFLALSA